MVRRGQAAMFGAAVRNQVRSVRLAPDGRYRVLVSNEHDRLLTMYRERVDGYQGVGDDFGDRWRAWCRAVLVHGGHLVVPPMSPEPDLDLLLAEGTLQALPVVELSLGGDCHANVAKLWIDGAVDAIGTGYALHDGLWRQHSWAFDREGALQDTKSRCERYVGVTLPPAEPTVRFALNHYDGDVSTMLASGTDRANEIVRVLRTVRSRGRDADA